MSLKQIPFEEEAKNAGHKKSGHAGHGKRHRHFNPGSGMHKAAAHDSPSLKSICLKLVHFINRGSKFSYEQLDELIVYLHHSIIKLQKKKHELLTAKNHQENQSGSGKKKNR